MKSSANLANIPDDEPPKEEEENRSIIATLAREFTEMTLIHGVKFIINKKALLSER